VSFLRNGRRIAAATVARDRASLEIEVEMEAAAARTPGWSLTLHPTLPWISEFPELNGRTYVRVDLESAEESIPAVGRTRRPRHIG